jgi:hypothetical protein
LQLDEVWWVFQTSEVDAKLAPVNVGPWHFVCWQIFKWTTFNKTTFAKNQKYKHCRKLKVKIQILLWRQLMNKHLRHIKFCKEKDHGHTYKFNLNHYFLWRGFWMWRWFEILRLCWDKHWMTLCRNL